MERSAYENKSEPEPAIMTEVRDMSVFFNFPCSRVFSLVSTYSTSGSSKKNNNPFVRRT